MGAGPVETKTDDGVVDWSKRQVRVVGVGTPRVVSNTGALTDGDLYQAARLDAERRIRNLLKSLPVGNGTTLGDASVAAPQLHKSVVQLVAGATRHFSDGTIHIPAHASFDWVSVALGARTKPAQKWADDAPTGLVLELTSAVEPTIQALLVSANGLTVSAGVQSDSVGGRGLAWVTTKAAALAHPLAGERPLVLPAAIGSSGPGQIFRLNVEAASVFASAGIQGGVVVVTPPRGTSP